MSGRLVFGREHLVKLCQQGLPAGFHAGSDLRHGGGQFGQVLVHQAAASSARSSCTRVRAVPGGSARSVTVSRVSNDGPCLRCGPMNPPAADQPAEETVEEYFQE